MEEILESPALDTLNKPVMNDILMYSDDLGPQKMLHLYGAKSGLRAVVCVDNTAAGAAIGGVRMAPDVTIDEAFRLARAMTLKNAAAGLKHGGGKSVIMADPKKMTEEEKEKIIRAFAIAIRDLKEYIPGPDMGTNETSMAYIQDEIGRCVGMPREIGGIPLDEIGSTGLGCYAAADVACAFYGIPMDGATVAIQGFGAVGKHAMRFMAEKGSVMVSAADSKGTITNPSGLDLMKLIDLKSQGKSVIDYTDGEVGDPEAIIDVECDIWVPAARPDIIHEGNFDRLNTKLVIQGANIPFTEQAEIELFKKGVHIIPDFIANAGGVITAAVEFAGGSMSDANNAVIDKISYNTEIIMADAKQKGIPVRDAAMEMAVERVRTAMSLTRKL